MRPPLAVILCGGLGTRLGSLTRATPKPLLPVGDRPFLEILIQEIARSGVRDFLLLASHMADQISSFAALAAEHLGGDLRIEVAVEQGQAGTGGALYQARDRLPDTFLLFNGDSLLDCRLHELGRLMADTPDLIGALALRHVEDSGRFGSVVLSGDTIERFDEKKPDAGPGLINGGVGLFRRTILDFMTDDCSLERDVLPHVVARGQLGGKVSDGYFIDIGLPETYQESQQSLLAHRRRKAVFLDRDGVLNVDHAHVGTIDRFAFTEGAIDALRLFNRLGYYIFVVTNQAGIAKEKYTTEDYWRLRDHIRNALFAAGAQIDDERYCPFHPEATLEQWRRESDWRKPGSGMLRDLLRCWPIELQGSFLIGDQATDIVAAEALGLPGFQFAGGNLLDFAESCLEIMHAESAV